jgi:hypothetical protein
MKVKTFTAGLANGLRKALDYLDERVQELGPIFIKSVKDTYYTEEQASENVCPGPRIVRVIVYKHKI